MPGLATTVNNRQKSRIRGQKTVNRLYPAKQSSRGYHESKKVQGPEAFFKNNECSDCHHGRGDAGNLTLCRPRGGGKAGEMSNSSAQVNMSAEELSKLAEQLKEQVGMLCV